MINTTALIWTDNIITRFCIPQGRHRKSNKLNCVASEHILRKGNVLWSIHLHIVVQLRYQNVEIDFLFHFTCDEKYEDSESQNHTEKRR